MANDLLPKKLTLPEKMALADCEAKIERGMETFYSVGSALLEIEEAKLYRAEFGTFEEYCQTRWNFKRTYAHYLMKSAKTVDALNVHNCEHLPSTESQARELNRLPEDQQADAWQEVTSTTEKPTAKIVKDVVDRRMVSTQTDVVEPTTKVAVDECAQQSVERYINSQVTDHDVVGTEVKPGATPRLGDLPVEERLPITARDLQRELDDKQLWAKIPTPAQWYVDWLIEGVLKLGEIKAIEVPRSERSYSASLGVLVDHWRRSHPEVTWEQLAGMLTGLAAKYRDDDDQDGVSPNTEEVAS